MNDQASPDLAPQSKPACVRAGGLEGKTLVRDLVAAELAAWRAWRTASKVEREAGSARFVARAWQHQGGEVPAAFADLYPDPQDHYEQKTSEAYEAALEAYERTRAAILASGLVLPFEGERPDVLLLMLALLPKEPSP